MVGEKRERAIRMVHYLPSLKGLFTPPTCHRLAGLATQNHLNHPCQTTDLQSKCGCGLVGHMPAA
jgi:hypothetical protein